MKYSYLVMMSIVFYCYAHAGDKPFTKRHTVVGTFSNTDYLTNTIHSVYWGFGLGAMYGYNQCKEQSCDYEALYPIIGALSTVIAVHGCMKLYSKIIDYYKSDSDEE